MIGKLTILTLAAAFALSSASCAAPATNPPPSGGQGHPRSVGQMCGGIAGFQCGGGLYCQFKEGTCRTIADVAGVCRPITQMCTMIYQPVCGCDGKTYPNACHAAREGVSVAKRGECR